MFAGFSVPFDPSLDRGSGDWDTRNNFTLSAIYNLPDMKGSSRLVQKTLGGWQASSILQTRSGLSQNVEVTNGFFGNYMRPDSVPAQPVKLANASWPNSSYNINAFTLEPGFNGVWGDPTTIGNIGRNLLRGPAFFQWDMSGMKNFAPDRESQIAIPGGYLQHPEPSELCKRRHRHLQFSCLPHRDLCGLHAEHTKPGTTCRIWCGERNHRRRRWESNRQWNCTPDAVLAEDSFLKARLACRGGKHLSLPPGDCDQAILQMGRPSEVYL